MTKGVYYDITFRLLIYKNHIDLGHDAEFIFNHCITNYQNISLD